MQITPISALFQIPDKNSITALHCTITEVQQARQSGTGNFGPYSYQNGKLADATGQIDCVFKDMQDMQHMRGLNVFMYATQGSKGLKGLSMKTDTYNNQSKRMVVISPGATIQANQQPGAAPAPAPAPYQPPPQQGYQPPPPQQPPYQPPPAQQQFQQPPPQQYQQPPPPAPVPNTTQLIAGQAMGKPRPSHIISKFSHVHLLCWRAAHAEARMAEALKIPMTVEQIGNTASSLFIAATHAASGLIDLNTFPLLEVPPPAQQQQQAPPQQQQLPQQAPPPPQPPPPPTAEDDNIPF